MQGMFILGVNMKSFKILNLTAFCAFSFSALSPEMSFAAYDATADCYCRVNIIAPIDKRIKDEKIGQVSLRHTGSCGESCEDTLSDRCHNLCTDTTASKKELTDFVADVAIIKNACTLVPDAVITLLFYSRGVGRDIDENRNYREIQYDCGNPQFKASGPVAESKNVPAAAVTIGSSSASTKTSAFSSGVGATEATNGKCGAGKRTVIDRLTGVRTCI